MYSKIDLSSFSNSSQIACRHLDINWTIDFHSHELSGHVKHTMIILDDQVTYAVFDSHQLKISRITITGTNNIETEAEFIYDDSHISLGNKVSVKIPQDSSLKQSEFFITFYYSANENSVAIQWLEPSATKGGKYPYLFTQCQAIHARSLLPCMDSPGLQFVCHHNFILHRVYSQFRYKSYL